MENGKLRASRKRIAAMSTAAAALAALAMATGAASQAGAPKPPTSLPDSYGQCAGCHGGNLSGGAFGPPLVGKAFHAKWQAKSKELIDYVKASMPPGNGGSLLTSDYVAIVNAILLENGIAAAFIQPDGPGNMAEHLATINGHAGPRPAAIDAFDDVIAKERRAQRAARLEKLRPVSDAELFNPPAEDWLTWRGGQKATGYSALAQINSKNVRKLGLAWSWSLPAGPNAIAPLVRDGVMFVSSGSEIFALTADNGTLLWKYSRDLAPQFRGPINNVQRSMALYEDKVIIATGDRHLVALGAKDGKVIWDSEVVPADVPTVTTTSGPAIANGVAIQGTSIGVACTGGCIVAGFDIASGRRLWTFNTVAQPGEPGSDTWNRIAAEERSGGASWIAGSYDPETDLYYFGTAGTYAISKITPLAPKDGSRDALYTNSTVALRPKTGELVWSHQHFPQELWDLDEVFERPLIELDEKGGKSGLVLSLGKVGILDALDRRNGKYRFSINLAHSNIVRSIDPETGARSIDAATVPTEAGVFVCPSAEGFRNWMATAYNPKLQILYVPMQDLCMTINRVPEGSPTSGRLDISWTLAPPADGDGKHGGVMAVDIVNRKTAWTTRQRGLPMSSLLSTAGGLLFTGDSDRWFSALDDRTGAILWRTRLSSVPISTPATYGVGGKQYIAVVAGGGAPHDVNSREVTPEIEHSAAGTTLMVFALDN